MTQPGWNRNPANGWHHFATVLTKKKMQYYIDGKEVSGEEYDMQLSQCNEGTGEGEHL
jgi:hypothetical protein